MPLVNNTYVSSKVMPNSKNLDNKPIDGGRTLSIINEINCVTYTNAFSVNYLFLFIWADLFSE